MFIKRIQKALGENTGYNVEGLCHFNFIRKVEMRNCKNLTKFISVPLIPCSKFTEFLLARGHSHPLFSGENLCWPAFLGFVCLLTVTSCASSLYNSL